MPHQLRVRLRSIAVLWTVLGPVCSALAQPSAATPQAETPITVVHLDGDDIVIDAGAEQLAHAQRLTLYRNLEVRHPITHKPLRDRFALGTLAVVQAGSRMSIVRAQGELSHSVVVGDSVQLQSRAAASNTPSAQPSPPSAAQPATPTTAAPNSTAAATGLRAPDSEERELLAYWYASLAKPPGARASLYQAFLQRHPGSRYRSYVLVLGDPRDMHLDLGAEAIRTVGATAHLRLGFSAAPQIPMGATIEVSTFPIGDDPGVRLLYDVGYRFGPVTELRLRGGYQGRTSVSGGAALALEIRYGF